ncbi:PHP domain-containing protein [Candidatus Woesearchaeota archaeon]|nr:PHP domain-containing protein [Candidatus Woesearchaeota archaeon]
MKIDLHLHTQFSYQGEIGHQPSDSVISLENLPALARQKGLGGLVITDHMTIEAGDEVYKRVKDNNPDLLLLRGMEYHSDHGHLLLFGLKNDDVCRIFGKYGPAQDVINYVQDSGGIVIPSHPYQAHYTYALEDKVFHLRGLSALEGINGQLHPRLNHKAEIAATKLNLPQTGGSDAHHPANLGRAYTLFENSISSVEDLITEIKLNRCSPRIISTNSKSKSP